MRLFNYDSPFMQALNKVADLLWLNVLTLICCIPIVTIGASMTGMHFVALKMARNEECYIARDFFKSFKRNFRQATIIWLMMLAAFAILFCDFYIMGHTEMSFSFVIRIGLMIIALMLLFVSKLVFPVLARFTNTVLRTIKNAFFIAILILPRTILMMVVSLLPAAILIFFPQILPIVLMFGFTGPAWVDAKLYSKVFKTLEDQIRKENPPEETEEDGEDERIFRDELDESLVEDSGIR